MRCSRAQKLIPLFINNDLQEIQRREVDDHLHRCGACKKTAAEYAALSRLAKAGSPPIEPEGFYDSFYDEVMVRVCRRSKTSEKSFMKGFEWPALHPRLAFAGIGAAIAVVVFALFLVIKNEGSRVTLETYLMQRNFAELARAVADDEQRPLLIADSVSVDLLIKSLKILDKMNTGYGQVAQTMAPVMAMLQHDLSKRIEQSVDDPDARAAPRVIQAGVLGGMSDFKKMIQALRLINRPGVKVTLIDLAKYQHRQTQL
jgi:hypothetical protein